MKTNYILIDFENVQPGHLHSITGLPIKVLVFVGEKQNKISLDLAQSLQNFGSDAEYVRIAGMGQNALDFHIAFWIGRLAERDPNSFFHIVSKDKGFDPLIAHLKSHKILAQRVSQLSEIHILNGVGKKTTAERAEFVITSLKTRGTSIPRRRKTLANTISAAFMKTIAEDEIDQIIQLLVSKKVITITDNKVTYRFPEVTDGEN